ncbi:MAG TPA: DUF4249 family protein, partial [Chitinophagaceae bacterium]|nr:DUF4249 family protein [Chitinophagaceae bacterium]
MYKVSLLIILSFLLIGCEKPVDFNLDESKTKLVVEAIIENDQPPVVVLTNSLNYFSEISPQLLVGSFVHNAQITISNDTKTHRLKEYKIPIFSGYNLYYYSIDSSTLATAFNGTLNTAYSLKIIADGAEYIATTTIPAITKKIDSMWWKPAPRDTANQIVNVMVKATDPRGYGDYVRYYTKRNGEPYLPGIASVYDDLIIDGTTYDLEVEPGYDRNADMTEDERAFKR